MSAALSTVSEAHERSLTETQRQLILGTMLGDGHLSCAKTQRNARYSSRHGWVQQHYNSAKYQILSEFVPTPPKKQKNGGWGEWSSVFATQSLPVLTSLWRLCFRLAPNGRYQKHVNQDWLAQLTWEGVAWWVGDDGHLNRVGRCMTLHTEGFCFEMVELLVAWLNANGVECWVSPAWNRARTRQYHRIACSVTGTAVLIANIAPFMPACMSYKVTLSPRCTEAVCAFCGTSFALTGNQTKDPAKLVGKRPCCRADACRKARLNSNTAKSLRKRGREHVNAQRRKAYWADVEHRREQSRKNAATYRATHREKLLAQRAATRAAKTAQRLASPLTCQRCKQDFPRLEKSSRVRYCPPCRQAVTREIGARHRAQKRNQQPAM